MPKYNASGTPTVTNNRQPDELYPTQVLRTYLPGWRLPSQHVQERDGVSEPRLRLHSVRPPVSVLSGVSLLCDYDHVGLLQGLLLLLRSALLG